MDFWRLMSSEETIKTKANQKQILAHPLRQPVSDESSLMTDMHILWPHLFRIHFFIRM